MARRQLSIGKIRALQRASILHNDAFGILALDHQDSLRRALDLPDAALVQFKMEVLSTLQNYTSGVLLDPVLGAAQAVQHGIARHIGLLVELEKADYSMEPLPLNVEIDPDWSVAKIKRMNADGVKLFFYYNPDDRPHAEEQASIIREAVAECAAHDIPLYAEPIMYSAAADSETYRADFSRLVIESARQIAALEVDVLKMEFPIDIDYQPDESAWLEACQQLTEAIEIPWVLLSAGVDFETFYRQVEIACKGGASGYIAGRAVWGDACLKKDPRRQRKWLAEEGLDRMRRLEAVARDRARPWTACYEPEPISTSWFKSY